MKEVAEFLKESGIYYLATNNKGEPDVRPMGFSLTYKDRLYFVTAKSMEVFLQLEEDNKISISVHSKAKWLRLYGTAILDDSKETIEALSQMEPKVTQMFPEDIMAPFYLKNVRASIYSFDQAPKVYSF